MKEYLPIGSIVKIRNSDEKIMITGFCVQRDKSKKPMDYRGCNYPEGMIDNNDYLVFNNIQITEVIHKGYESEEEKEFKKRLNEVIKKEEEK